MKVITLAAAALAGCVGVAHAAVLGPTPYLSQADSPFAPADFSYFFLEDLEDDALNAPGLSASGPSLCITGFNCFVGAGITDSVGNGGNGALGRTLFTNGAVSLSFDGSVLGGLPTAAGLVWTDGGNPITFEAFDQNGASLGAIVGNHADGLIGGQIDEDRFYGAVNAGGISRLAISNPAGLEIDHIQYGGLRAATVAEPTSLALVIGGLALVGVARRRMAALPG
jgi:hypothetical protein